MSIDDIVGSLFGGDKADDAYEQQERVTQKQSEYLEKQSSLFDEVGEVGREQLDYYKKTYRPIEQDFIAKAREGVDPDYEGITNLAGQASQEVGRQYDIGRGSARRALTRRGGDASAGGYRSFELSSRLGEAASKAGVITRANIAEADSRRIERKYADETSYNRLSDATKTGRGLETIARTGLTSAAAGAGQVAAGYGGQASQYGRIADQRADAAGDLAASVFSLGATLSGKPSVPKVESSGEATWV